MKNNTLELTKMSLNKIIIDMRWIFKLKMKLIGEITKHKARLVVKCFTQKMCLDYDEVFLTVERL